MLKYFCDKCNKELTKEDKYHCEIKVKGFTRITDTFNVEYCKECLKGIIGQENYIKLCEFEEERKKRREELKKQREEKT